MIPTRLPALLRRFLVLAVSAAVAIAASPRAFGGQGFTTVITHGFSAGSKGAWVQGMAEAIIARAGGGAAYRYDESDGLWHLVAVDGASPDVDLTVLIFNWVPESAGVSAGPNWNYAQAAGDALYAAMRDPRYAGAPGPADLAAGRTLHFIGHSRGACVNSETILRLLRDGVPVDQMTSHDPHPVNGTLDSPYNYNWGDPVPQKWSNVAFSDDCWRADGGGIFNGLDFDGIALANTFNTQLSEAALNCCAYSFSHSDVHLWYHGTIDVSPSPCDGEECINAQMRSTWWPEGYAQRGYYYAALGGGASQRPAQPGGIEPASPAPLLFNGDFPQATYAGWTYHGGAVNGQVTTDAGDGYLRLGAGSGGTQARHNRFYLPSGQADITFDLRVFTAGPGQALEVALTDRDGVEYQLASLGVPVATGWQTGYDVPVDRRVPRDRAYTLTFRLDGPGAITATIGIDDIAISVTDATGDINGDGVVDIDDLFAVINAWGACPAPPAPCAADLDGDADVDVDDLFAVINHWS